MVVSGAQWQFAEGLDTSARRSRTIVASQSKLLIRTFPSGHSLISNESRAVPTTEELQPAGGRERSGRQSNGWFTGGAEAEAEAPGVVVELGVDSSNLESIHPAKMFKLIQFDEGKLRQLELANGYLMLVQQLLGVFNGPTSNWLRSVHDLEDCYSELIDDCELTNSNGAELQTVVVQQGVLGVTIDLLKAILNRECSIPTELQNAVRLLFRFLSTCSGPRIPESRIELHKHINFLYLHLDSAFGVSSSCTASLCHCVLYLLVRI